MSGLPLTITNDANGVASDSVITQADPSVLNALNGTDPNASVGNSTMAPSNSTTTSTSTTTTTQSPQDDDVEGSGDDDDNDDDNRNDLTSLFSIGSFITRAALFRRSIRSVDAIQSAPQPIQRPRKSKQFYSTCNDRITLPCIIEDFISVGTGGSIPTCSPIHCGNSLCSSNVSPCRVESTVTPFGIGIHFGDGRNKGGAEENIGACIRYKQLNCI